MKALMLINVILLVGCATPLTPEEKKTNYYHLCDQRIVPKNFVFSVNYQGMFYKCHKNKQYGVLIYVASEHDTSLCIHDLQYNNTSFLGIAS